MSNLAFKRLAEKDSKISELEADLKVANETIDNYKNHIRELELNLADMDDRNYDEY